MASRVVGDAGVAHYERDECPHRACIVTDRDLCLAVIAMGKHPDSVPVGEAMTSLLVACQSGDNLRQAPALMHGNQVRQIPVVDQEGRLQGMGNRNV